MDESVKSRKTYVAARAINITPIYRSRSGAKTNTPATYCTGPSTRLNFVESEPSIALEQWNGGKERRRPHLLWCQ
uniref:Uncharacterized protein n=1 Tax=Utricularia reniformis TaxID=192314 RepID=A0A1Y0B390_9LAMI|nr:hypothetical protein AEK19_MT1727 [Utricularia reniformis]ART31906.1 hypothetical protein AEK19_MT1727 [Utricularia reniformis]